MQLPQFEYVESKSLKDAACFLQEKGRQSMLIGGGTDMLPSMKQGVYHPTYIISLAAVPDLKQIQFDDNGGVKLGSALKLCSLENSADIKKRFPIVAQAARAVGSPQLREMGTLGGNLCLDTRCYYYNQSETWRKCRTACIKMGGDVCNAIGSGKKCFAVFSGDMAPALIALNARIVFHSARGERTIPLDELYSGDGARPLAKQPDEILLRVEIPGQQKGAIGTYSKYRIRKSIDYPLAGVATMLAMDNSNKVCRGAKVVISAVGTRPAAVNGITELLKDKKLDDSLIEEASDLAYKAAKPIANTAGTPSHRKVMIKAFVKRALEQASGV
jgi:4-hydroxybenzoyl-CoA reductase subunit beta